MIDKKTKKLSDWDRNKLGEICELLYGNSLPQNVRINGCIPVYGSNGQIGTHNKSMTNEPTIIIGRKGSIGEVHYSNEPCWIIDTAYHIKIKTNINIKYLYWLLDFLKLNRLNKSTAIPGLNRDDVYKIDVLIPPLNEQERLVKIIETKLNAVEKSKMACLNQLDYINTLSSSILRNVFNGEY
ncbi:MAG: restriction endonuclease subunit S [Treponema sp.]|nr:restriction endonuclease subunit S [Treponema sp.]